MTTATIPISPVKPLLRGVSHQIACGVALIAGAGLVAMVPSGTARWAALTYATCLTALFGISAAYHRPTWQPTARAWMRRLDHAAIFLLIAGTYTPLCFALASHDAFVLLSVVWAGAIAGVLQSMLWVTAPKPLIAVLYVILGWSVLPYLSRVHAAVGLLPLLLLLVGGIFYSAGAVVYARKRPDPVPAIFGYHEVFHALTIAAAIAHFASVCLVLLPR